MAEVISKPCEFCGELVEKTARQQSQRKYWTCGPSHAAKLAIRTRDSNGESGRRPNRFRGQRESRPCAKCGTALDRYLTEDNHGSAWLCRRCSTGALREIPRTKHGDEIPCSNCGKLFYRTPSDISHNRKYHSTECAYKRFEAKPRVTVTCAVCGRQDDYPSSVAKTRKYCDNPDCSRQGRFKNALERTHNSKPARLTGDGYVKIWEPEHPKATHGWVLEHRWLMEQHLGYVLDSTVEVDHKNRNRSDNRLENLQVLNKSDHRRKTGADSRQVRLTMREKLAAYEAKYGPLEE